MEYTKPEVRVVGDALDAIQGIKKLSGDDANGTTTVSAYDIDE